MSLTELIETIERLMLSLAYQSILRHRSLRQGDTPALAVAAMAGAVADLATAPAPSAAATAAEEPDHPPPPAAAGGGAEIPPSPPMPATAAPMAPSPRPAGAAAELPLFHVAIGPPPYRHDGLEFPLPRADQSKNAWVCYCVALMLERWDSRLTASQMIDALSDALIGDTALHDLLSEPVSTALGSLKRGGRCRGEGKRDKMTYRLTPAGRAWLDEQRAAWPV